MAMLGYRSIPGKPKSLAQLVAEAEAEITARNQAREAEIRSIYSDMYNLYAPGGAMEKAGLQQIERAKVGSVSGSMQRDISRGLYGIRPYEQEWEATTGVGARMTLEDMLTRGRAAIMGQKASFVERIEDEYPDLSAVERAYAAQSSIPSGVSGTSPSNRPGWSISGTYGGVGVDPSTTDYSALNERLRAASDAAAEVRSSMAQATPLSQEFPEFYDDNTVMSTALKNYIADVKKANPNASTSHINLDYFKRLLAKTPKNTSRGVWKAYTEAGGK